MKMENGESVYTFPDLVEPTLYYSIAKVTTQSLCFMFSPNFNQIP